MLIPILFVVGLALVGLKVGQKLRPSDFQVGVALPAPKLRSVSYVNIVSERLAHNLPVSEWLVCEATREAFDRGDWETVRNLTIAFDAEQGPALQEHKEQVPEKPEAPETSPLEGVEPDSWTDFCQALSTKDAGFKSERYIGKYEQNINRLRQLGLEVPANEADEYKALVADMSDYWESEQKLIHNHSGEVVSLSGQDVAVTPSGILGLLKAAGPNGARSWLENEEDRVRFPRTTETFNRTNACF